jgi:hypothetical protein
VFSFVQPNDCRVTVPLDIRSKRKADGLENALR